MARLPLAAGLMAANRPDSTVFAALADGTTPIQGRRGRPRRRPARWHADKRYDYRHCRAPVRRRGVVARLARKGVADKATLGQHRRVVECTPARLARIAA